MPLPRVNTNYLYLGCDPEFFFKSKNNRVIGAEKIIPEQGLKNTVNSRNGGQSNDAVFVIDGVQAELHPRPQTCRAYLANEISACFKSLKKELEKQGNGVTVGFEQSVKISKTELSKLDEKYQKLGCSPSKNSYEDTGAKLKAIDPLTHRQRSAGGHIHIGYYTKDNFFTMVKENPDHIVKLLDIIVGNTCVLIDRDKGNVQRRKLYGFAGEYRLPEHGLEYRTLSNFWLQAYPLMSLAFGLARYAVHVAVDIEHPEIAKSFLDAVNIEDVRKAINTNNFNLAYKNFKKIESLIAETAAGNSHHPLNHYTLNEFNYFVEKIQKEGLGYWFKEDPLTHWTNLKEAHAGGMYDFLSYNVREDMRKEKQKVLEKNQPQPQPKQPDF